MCTQLNASAQEYNTMGVGSSLKKRIDDIMNNGWERERGGEREGGRRGKWYEDIHFSFLILMVTFILISTISACI